MIRKNKKNPKILIITTAYLPFIGGIEISLSYLKKFLQKSGYSVDIFCMKALKSNFYLKKNILYNRKYSKENFLGYNPFRNFSKKIKIFLLFLKIIFSYKESSISEKVKEIYSFIKTNQIFFLIGTASSICNFYRRKDYDIILSGDANLSAFIGAIINQYFNARWFIIAHGNDLLQKKIFKNYCLNFSNGIITRTYFIKRLVQKMYNITNSKFHIIPDGVIKNEYEIKKSKITLRDKYGLDSDEIILLTVGRLESKRKGFDNVLKSLKLVCKKDKQLAKNIKYVILGKASKKAEHEINSLIRRLNLDEKVIIKTNVNDETRNEFYKLSDIFIMPSKRDKKNKSIEGFGNVFIEAAFYGIPTIGSYSGGIPEAVVNKKSGFLVNQNNIEEIADKILLLAKNEDLRKKMGNYGRNRVFESFLWEKLIYKYIKAFSKI